MQPDVFHQFIESDVGSQYVRVSCQQKLLAGPCDGYVQFAVNQELSFAERIAVRKFSWEKLWMVKE